MESELFPVTSFEEGEEGVVHLLSGGESLTSRLAGLGIAPGTRIKVLRKSGGLIILFASDTRVALGRGQAEKILAVKIEASESVPIPVRTRKKLLVTLAGQPNVGKTTVFNVLTGLSQHIGNWPGKTVERAEGTHLTDDSEITIVDLPGTYSLSAFSEEERVARDFIIQERPDAVVLIVNAAALERSLYLLSELLLLERPIIVGVNMLDVAESQGMRVDVEALEDSLGLPVIPMVASRNRGIRELVAAVESLSRNGKKYSPRLPGVSADHQEIFLHLVKILQDHVPIPFTTGWVATKLMEGDPEVMETMEGLVPASKWEVARSLLSKHEDALRAVVGGRYDWIEGVTRAAVQRFKRGQVLMTDRIDHILTRPLFGMPILFAILGLVFLLTFKVGFPLQALLENVMSGAGSWLEAALAQEPKWLRGLLVNGVIGGAGSVITFVPLLAIFFSVIAFLESVGYMARAAFVMDKFMHIIGLHGKSFLPMCLGFGCNVPAVMGARIVESRRARLLTIFLAPFVPCSGRLGTLTFVTAGVFGRDAFTATWFLVCLNILALGLAGIVVSRTFLKHEPVPFIMELPLYHRPDIKAIGMVVASRTMAFVRKAGTVIVIFSVLLWIMSNVPGGTVDQSMLGWIGRFLAPLGIPLGLDWKLIIALLSSIVAKENSIATLGVLYHVGEQGLLEVLPSVVDKPSALSFLVVLMLFIPCAATTAAMKQEMDNWKWFVASVLFMLGLSYAAGIAVYQGALYLGL